MNTCTNYVGYIVFKSTIANMVTVQIFDVMSSKSESVVK
jgi:hypothetical protein